MHDHYDAEFILIQYIFQEHSIISYPRSNLIWYLEMVTLKLKLEEKSRVIKNFVAINVAFMLLFSAVNCTNSIQSFINKVDSLGTISQRWTKNTKIISLNLRRYCFLWAIRSWKFHELFCHELSLKCVNISANLKMWTFFSWFFLFL